MKIQLNLVKGIIAYNHVLSPSLFFLFFIISDRCFRACLFGPHRAIFSTQLRLFPPLTQLVSASFRSQLGPQPADYYQKSYRH